MSLDGAILLPYQRAWVEDRAQVKIWEKSRRIGASYCEAADDVLHAASAEGGGNVGYISYNKSMTASYISDCAKWAKAFHHGASAIGEEVLKRDDGRDIHVFDLQFASGHSIQAFSGNPRNLRSFGRPGDVVVVDEAAFIDDLAELLKAAMAVTVWGGEIRILSTHNGEDNPFNELIRDTRGGRYRHSIHRTTIDDALQDGLYRRICAVTNRVWSAENEAEWLAELIQRYRPNEDEELRAIPTMGGGTYFPRAIVEAAMLPAEESGPVLRYSGSAAFNLAPLARRRADMQDWIDTVLAPALATLDPDLRHAIGMDFARSGDTTSIVIAETGADLRRTWRLVVELHNVPYDQQEQVLAWIEGFELQGGNWIRTGRGAPRLGGEAIDSTGNGEVIGEHAHDRRGSQVIQVKISESWYREWMPRYKVAIEDRTTRMIRHDDVLEDHRAVQLVRGVPRVPDRKTDSRGERHGDSAIAGCLANQAADEGVAEYAYHPIDPVGAGRRPGDHRRSRRAEEMASAMQPRMGGLRRMLSGRRGAL